MYDLKSNYYLKINDHFFKLIINCLKKMSLKKNTLFDLIRVNYKRLLSDSRKTDTNFDIYLKNKEKFGFTDLINLKKKNANKYESENICNKRVSLENNNVKNNSKNEGTKTNYTKYIICVCSFCFGFSFMNNYDELKNFIFRKFNFEKKKEFFLIDDNNKKRLKQNFLKEFDKDTIKTFGNDGNDIGLYAFGEVNDKSLPIRIPFFDNMTLKDVKCKKKFLVVVDQKGKVYQQENVKNKPFFTKLPFNVEKCVINEDYIYTLSDNGKVFFFPRFDKIDVKKKNTFLSKFFFVSDNYQYERIKFNEKIENIAIGKSHLLFLSKTGKVYVTKHLKDFNNHEQYGLPEFLGSLGSKNLLNNEPHEVLTLNNKLTKNKIVTIEKRKFKKIATGDYHNLVVDVSNNVWAWGSNKWGQCGIDVSYNTSVHYIPKLVFSKTQLHELVKKTFLTNCEIDDICVENVFCCSNTSYMLINAFNHLEKKDFLLLYSFGNGENGELGNNRYIQLLSKPYLIKPLTNLFEYDEKYNKNRNIKIKDLSSGNSHVFVTLQNSGPKNDAMTFGNNRMGQFGIGKRNKSNELINIPKLLDNNDLKIIEDKNQIDNFVKKFYFDKNNRLSLSSNIIVNKKKIEQVIKASENSSFIYYKKVESY